jgi:hypothetical protein
VLRDAGAETCYHLGNHAERRRGREPSPLQGVFAGRRCARRRSARAHVALYLLSCKESRETIFAVVPDDGDPRNVIIDTISIVVKDRPDIVVRLATAAELAQTKATMLQFKEGKRLLTALLEHDQTRAVCW